MSFKKVKESFSSDLEEIKKAGLWKTERIINSDQKSKIQLSDNQEVINMCANNYLGLANNPEVIQAAKDGLDRWGFGLASVRFICGTQTLHKTLEEKVSEYLGMEDTILYAACFDANGGLFEKLQKKYDLSQPEEFFCIETFKKRPELFYEFAKEFDMEKYEPTICHVKF